MALQPTGLRSLAKSMACVVTAAAVTGVSDVHPASAQTPWELAPSQSVLARADTFASDPPQSLPGGEFDDSDYEAAAPRQTGAFGSHDDDDGAAVDTSEYAIAHENVQKVCHGCGNGCAHCRPEKPARPEWRFNALCEPAGLLQRLCAVHDETDALWTGRVDGLLLWRNAPPGRYIAQDSLSASNANQLESTPAAGPRLSLFRQNTDSGTAWETTYLRAANFRSQRNLLTENGTFSLSPPGIYGNSSSQFQSGYANLGSSIQSLEFNRHVSHGKLLRFLAGFRWVEWQEQFTLETTTTDPSAITDLYQTGCTNSMYGGQIGLDAYLLSLPWLRIDSVIKAGAYYNNAVQQSIHQQDNAGVSASQSIRVGTSPASCAFIGELGFTGVMPITNCLDLRFGYFGLWLDGIAQPTQQLSGQRLDLDAPPIGTLATNGGTVVQGVSLGLEGRW